MHALQPMQRSESKSTMPSGRLWSATVGQISTHGASSQCWHRSIVKYRRVLGKVPFSTYLTQVRNTPSGTSFSDLQATVQAWQPMHLRWSMTNPYLVNSNPFPRQMDGSLAKQRVMVPDVASPLEVELRSWRFPGRRSCGSRPPSSATCSDPFHRDC